MMVGCDARGAAVTAGGRIGADHAAAIVERTSAGIGEPTDLVMEMHGMALQEMVAGYDADVNVGAPSRLGGLDSSTNKDNKANRQRHQHDINRIQPERQHPLRLAPPSTNADETNRSDRAARLTRGGRGRLRVPRWQPARAQLHT